jgi:hypothetical protein
MAYGAEKGLDYVAEHRPVVLIIKKALREEGHRVSGNAIARGAKFLGKSAFAVHVGFAMADGREDYKACMAN